MSDPVRVARELVLVLHDQLLAVMPYLVDVLGQFDGANYLLEHRPA